MLSGAQTAQRILPSADVDRDGIDDNIERSLLARFRPFYRFSDDGHGGADNFRPADVWFYVRTSDLHTDGDEDGQYTMVKQRVLASNPLALLVPDGKYHSSNITQNATLTGYRINPNEHPDGFSGDNPGRHGNPWPDELAAKNIGLYGHVNRLRVPGQQHELYKIEYWQFFGYNSADKPGDIGDHEGDWTSVQVLYDPLGDSMVSVMHYAHGIEFRFDLQRTVYTRSYQDQDGWIQERRGANYGSNIDLVSHDLKFTKNASSVNAAQNNVLLLFQEPGTRVATHPVVYIEHGTHEFFPSQAWDYYAAPSHNGKSYHFLTNPPPNLGEVENPMSETQAAPLILKFNGYWGAYCKINCSPPGPPLHANWLWPANSGIRRLLTGLTY